MEKYNVKDFANVLSLRNQLVNVPIEKLEEVYQDYDNYVAFLDTVAVMTNIDSAFLLFKADYLKKIENVIQIHRFDTKDKDVKDAINSIIEYINTIKSYRPEYRKLLTTSYVSYQAKARNTNFASTDMMLYSLGYDALSYVAITEGDMDKITEDDMFLASINYFIETIPEIFKDEDTRKRTLEKIEELEKKGRPFNRMTRNYSKETKESFQKIKLKEE